MSRKLTKADASAFKKRWRLVSAREAEEMHATSIAVKWKHFNALFGMARALGWTEPMRLGEDEVRKRWMRLRKALLGQDEKT